MATNGAKQPKKIGKTISYSQTANRLVSLTDYCFSPFIPNCHAWSQAMLSSLESETWYTVSVPWVKKFLQDFIFVD